MWTSLLNDRDNFDQNGDNNPKTYDVVAPKPDFVVRGRIFDPKLSALYTGQTTSKMDATGILL